MESTSFQSLLEFDTPSAEFSRGFEAGRIWCALRDDPDRPIDVVAHASNTEMFMRMGETTGRAVRSEDLRDEWINVAFAGVDGSTDDPLVM